MKDKKRKVKVSDVTRVVYPRVDGRAAAAENASTSGTGCSTPPPTRSNVDPAPATIDGAQKFFDSGKVPPPVRPVPADDDSDEGLSINGISVLNGPALPPAFP